MALVGVFDLIECINFGFSKKSWDFSWFGGIWG